MFPCCFYAAMYFFVFLLGIILFFVSIDKAARKRKDKIRQEADINQVIDKISSLYYHTRNPVEEEDILRIEKLRIIRDIGYE